VVSLAQARKQKGIVKRKTIEMTEMVNFKEGYKRVGIYSPTEVIESDE
jgi:hypothetical protein